MSTPAHRRLMADLERIQRDPPNGVSAAPNEDDIMLWDGVISGLDGTVFEGGEFKLQLKFTEEYPMRPPIARFISNVFHPNVFPYGRICLDMLQTQWSSEYDVSAILLAIQCLLSDPNPSSSANSIAGYLYESNISEYNKRVRNCVAKSRTK